MDMRARSLETDDVTSIEIDDEEQERNVCEIPACGKILSPKSRPGPESPITLNLVKKQFPKISEKGDRTDEHNARILIPATISPKKPPRTYLHQFDEQLSQARRTTSILDEQVKILRQENNEMKEFIRDVLYTLNARGYESLTDSRGGIIDLNRCRGEHYLELKGRDARARNIPGKKIQAHEHLLKAVIGSQEKLIRNLVTQVHKTKKNDINGGRMNPGEGSGHSSTEAEDEKSVLLEREILALVNSLESAIERHPGVYSGLKEQLFFEATSNGVTNGILRAVILRHQQLSNNTRQSLVGTEEMKRPRNSSRNALRRKVTSCLGELKKETMMRPQVVVGKGGHGTGTFREKYNQRPPTSPNFPLKPIIHIGDEESTIMNRQKVNYFGPTTSKNLINSPMTRRPATSFNECTSSVSVNRKIKSRWGQ